VISDSWPGRFGTVLHVWVREETTNWSCTGSFVIKHHVFTQKRME